WWCSSPQKQKASRKRRASRCALREPVLQALVVPLHPRASRRLFQAKSWPACNRCGKAPPWDVAPFSFSAGEQSVFAPAHSPVRPPIKRKRPVSKERQFVKKAHTSLPH